MVADPVHKQVQLSAGDTTYRVDGDPDAPLLLLVHGATVPAWEFDRVVPFLVDAGFRCLRFDLFGHGSSARPQRPHDYRLFTEQTAELLAALGVDRVHGVIGHSLGAAITTHLAIADQLPGARLALVAPLLDFVGPNPALRLVTAPGLGELLMPTVVLPALVRRRTKRYQSLDDGRFVGLFHQQLARPGFGRSLLSLLRHGALADQSASYAALATTEHPALLIRGSDDTIVPEHQLHTVQTLIGRAECDEVDGTGHALLLTHPESIAPRLIEFFSVPS
ncbi:MAG: alpha/beta fold hydrolase [Pseudomonadota bacterium]